MKDKITALLFILTLFASFVLTGFFSFKSLCGEQEKVPLTDPRDVNCMCLGIINLVSEDDYNKYHCTGLNFSYNNRFLMPKSNNALSSVYAKKQILSSRIPVPRDLQYCTKDEDCVLVKNSCRSNCILYGGTDYDLSINKKYLAEWQQKLDCQVVISEYVTELCPMAKAVCADSVCTDISIDIQDYYR